MIHEAEAYMRRLNLQPRERAFVHEYILMNVFEKRVKNLTEHYGMAQNLAIELAIDEALEPKGRAA